MIRIVLPCCMRMVETEIAILWGNVWRVAGDLLLSFRKCLAGNIGRKSIRYNLSGHSVRKKQWNTDRGRDSQKTAWQNDTDHLYFHLSHTALSSSQTASFNIFLTPLTTYKMNSHLYHFIRCVFLILLHIINT